MPAHASSHLANASTAWSVHRFSQPSDSSFMHTIYFQQYISCTLNWLQHLFSFHSYAWWHGQHYFVDLPLAYTVLLTLCYTHSFTPRHTNKRWLPVNHYSIPSHASTLSSSKAAADMNASMSVNQNMQQWLIIARCTALSHYRQQSQTQQTSTATSSAAAAFMLQQH